MHLQVISVDASGIEPETTALQALAQTTGAPFTLNFFVCSRLHLSIIVLKNRFCKF